MDTNPIIETRLDAVAIVRLLANGDEAGAEHLIRTSTDTLDLAGALGWLATAVLRMAGDQDAVDFVLTQLSWLAKSNPS